MLRNKLKVIALMIVMIVSLTIPVVRAENETSTDELLQHKMKPL